MIVLSNDLVQQKSQTQRMPLRLLVEAIKNDVAPNTNETNTSASASTTIDKINAEIISAQLSTLDCSGVTAAERIERAKAAEQKIVAKYKELEDKHIDDSNIKQTISGVEKVISVASHSIDDNLRFIRAELLNEKEGTISSLIKEFLDPLLDDLDDFDILMTRYRKTTTTNYMNAIGKDLTFSMYMYVLGRKPEKLDEFNDYLELCTESALDDEDIKAAKQQGIDGNTRFDMVKNLVKPPIVFRVHGAMAAAAQESFEQNDALDKLIGETLPAFADEIFERDDKDGLFGAFCDIYDELKRK